MLSVHHSAAIKIGWSVPCGTDARQRGEPTTGNGEARDELDSPAARRPAEAMGASHPLGGNGEL